MNEKSTSQEDYLEAIYRLSLQQQMVRSTDVARMMGVKTPSVFLALQELIKKALVTKIHYGTISLTEMGVKMAKEIFKKHEVIRLFLSKVLKVSAATADKDACRIEHHLSEETTTKLFAFMERNIHD
ncbi:MAG: metal-dependent transcriptional regulator [Erysipelotrichaceae bacterium]|jgi:Mn-dependent DtxR family transcriptional regulator|nr:metal-dependent transcriptional regulator [Erysipelotrichaceae bacterium]